MEENLMEKLLNDFSGTLEQFNELVRQNDYDGVKRVLDEVNRLLQERNGIVLDDREPQYDHVLHEVLDKMKGIVEKEITVTGIDGVPGTRYYTNEQVREMIAEAEKELEEISRMVETYKDINPEAYAQARSDRSKIVEKIQLLKNSLVEGQEFSTLTYIDPRLAELQEERARLLKEKEENLKEIARLRAEETPGIPDSPADQARLEVINRRLTELENLFSDIEGQITAIRNTKISELIENLRTETARIPELEARRTALEEELRKAAERVNETRGFDEQNAQARADYSAIVRQIADLDSEISRTEQNEENISFLESLVPEVEQTENVLDPMDYTYMGRLSDEEIIRRLLSEQLHLSQEEIDATIGQYSLVQAESGSHDEYGEDNPISMRRLVRTQKVKGDLTVGEALDSLEAQLHDGPVVDHSEEIAEIDRRIEELDKIISDSEARIEEIGSRQISDLTQQRQLNESQIAELESLLPEVKQTENVLDPMDYTYMGRLSDEEIIRRLLSEQLHLSQEEIDATIGQYSLVQAEQGAHDEYGEDNPISMRRLVRTQNVKGQLTVKEGIEKLDQELSELEARRNALEEELRKAGDRVRETRGFDEQNAQARADYSDIVRQISEIDAQIASVRARQTSVKEISGIKEEEDKINAAKAEKEELANRKKELEQDNSRQENPEVRAKINKLKEISGITALELQLQKYREEYEKLQKEKEGLVGTKGKPGIDNSEKIAALEARNREIDARIAEIDKEIEGMTGVVHTTTQKETLDVEKEAHKIGDHIFKTAAIRRELASRNISRDEFLAFYKEGYAKTNAQIDKLAEEYKKFLKEIETVLADPENPTNRIDVLMREAEKAGDTELVAKLAEKMRKNFIAIGREDELKVAGLDHEITSAEDVGKLKQLYGMYIKSVQIGVNQVKDDIAELKENAGIFAKEIARINAEKATIELAGKSTEELEARTEERKKLRRLLLEASITPKKDLTEEQKELLESWQDASERFLGKKTTAKYIYVDKNGVEHAVDVDSIDDKYPEYAKDVEFLGVPAYKENLEQISAWEQTKDPYVFGEEVGRAYEAAEAQKEGTGKAVLEKILADKRQYVETFNGIPNPHKVKYENWKTAGSTLKGMLPVSRDLPMKSRAKNAVENVFRFLGFRAPKFSRIDENGNKVRDITGGAVTLALDGLVATAVGVTAVTLGPAMVGIGYAAKGIVTAGNKVAAKIEYARHKDEIDGNKPVLNQADRNAREVARKHYYREQGDNRLLSWFKAKTDKYFTRKREKETEAAIVDKLAREYSEAEDKRTEAIKGNLEIAEANQLARLKRQTQIAMGANAYNDIVRDPDSVDMDAATAAIARNAALEASKPGAGREDVNARSNAERKEQYVKEEKPVDKTSDLEEIPEEAAKTSGPVSAITAEQIYTGRKQHVDRLNKVLTAVTAAGLKFGYTAWKDGFMDTKEIQHDPIYEEKEITHDPIYEEVEVQDMETQYDASKTLEDVMRNADGKNVDGYYSVSGGLRGHRTVTIDGDKNITAGWVAEDSAMHGTGISDAQGLTAPTLTDRLATNNLLDSNGVLRQDISVGELLNTIGGPKPDLKDLEGIFVSYGDRCWIEMKQLMEGMTHDVVVGSHWEKMLVKPEWTEIVKVLVKEGWTETIKIFKPELVAKALVEGAAAGAAISTADALHEAAQNTYINGITPGRPEESMPEALDTFEMIANKIFDARDKAEKEAELKAEKEAEKEAKKEAKREAKEAKKDAKEAEKEAKKEAKEAEKEAKEAKKQDKKDAKRQDKIAKLKAELAELEGDEINTEEGQLPVNNEEIDDER